MLPIMPIATNILSTCNFFSDNNSRARHLTLYFVLALLADKLFHFSFWHCRLPLEEKTYYFAIICLACLEDKQSYTTLTLALH